MSNRKQSPIAAAERAFSAAVTAAEQQYERDVAEAARRRDEAQDAAAVAFQAVLDAELASSDIKANVRYIRPDGTRTGE